MTASCRSLLVLLALVVAGVNGDNLRLMMTYDYDPSEMGWLTVLSGNGASPAEMVAAHNHDPLVQGMPGLPNTIFDRAGRTLHTAWMANTQAFVQDIRPGIDNGTFIGVFLGDEIVCSGTPLQNFTSVLKNLRAGLGRAAVLYANECAEIQQWLSIPEELDYISLNYYDEHNTNGTGEADKDRFFYETHVYPKLHPHQGVLLVPGIFASDPVHCTQGNVSCPLDKQAAQVVQKLDKMFSWAKEDPRVRGFNPWHFSNRTGPQLGGWWDQRLGAVAMPTVVSKLREIGMHVRQNLKPSPIVDVLARPSAAHLLFHEDTIGAISHFGMQTFVENRTCPNVFPVDTFNPTLLDTDQWVRAAASFGAKYYVLVVDHFSGFSLYPTKAHNYSVGLTKWRDGRADIVKDFVASCKKYGIRPGFYYSLHENWYYNVCDFNLTDPTAQSQYEDMAMTQLEEIASRFGEDAAEIWFDGGVKGSLAFNQRVDEFVLRKMPKTSTCHSCQSLPNARQVSWMGNEVAAMPYGDHGVWNANDATCSKNAASPAANGNFGIPNGTVWCAAHCDAVLRNHFWFWANHSYDQPSNLNNASKLVAMHMTSVGRGCNMILDLSPTPTGLLQTNDMAAYAAFGAAIETLYSNPVAEWSNLFSASTSPFEVEATLSGGQASKGKMLSRGAIELRENMTNGQAISSYKVQYCGGTEGAGGGARVSDDDEFGKARRADRSLAKSRQGLPHCDSWTDFPLRNGNQLTIGNRRIHWFEFSSAGARVPTSVTQFRVSIQTLRTSNHTNHRPCLRSAKLYDWSDPKFDALLVHVANVQ